MKKPESRFWFWYKLMALCAGLVTLMLVASAFLVGKKNRNIPAIYGTVTVDLEATERDGSIVRLSALRGKVFTCAYIYTVCPHGCAAVMGQMMKLHHRFGSQDDFHQVSITVAPERDTASFMASYAQGLALEHPDRWWFLTGEQARLSSFMEQGLKMSPSKPIPPEERLNPLDLYMHDLRIVLIDRKGQVRGYYEVFHPHPEIASLMCERLQRDTETLLKHPEF